MIVVKEKQIPIVFDHNFIAAKESIGAYPISVFDNIKLLSPATWDRMLLETYFHTGLKNPKPEVG